MVSGLIVLVSGLVVLGFVAEHYLSLYRGIFQTTWTRPTQLGSNVPLSRAAMRKIGLCTAGLAKQRVKVRVCQPLRAAPPITLCIMIHPHNALSTARGRFIIFMFPVDIIRSVF